MARIGIVALTAVTCALTMALVPGAGAGERGATKSVTGWAALPPSPLTRTEVGAVRIGGSAYVVGGFAAPNSTRASLARYEIESREWTIGPDMPIWVNHPAVTSYRGMVYVHGGYDLLGHEIDALQRFNPATGDWKMLAPSGLPRAAGALATVGKRLYSIGGAPKWADATTLVQVYDPERDRWSAGPPMRTAREHITSVVLGRRIIVIGGREAGENMAVVEQLNTGNGRWRPLAPLRVARSAAGAAMVKGTVVVVGGEDLVPGGSTTATVEQYLPRSKSWKQLPPMITPRHGHGVVSLGRRLFALEGGPQAGSSFSNIAEVLLVPKNRLPRR